VAAVRRAQKRRSGQAPRAFSRLMMMMMMMMMATASNESGLSPNGELYSIERARN
jgi:hypothetical protein